MHTTWDRDGEHLNLLAIGYYVKAGLWAMTCAAGAFYVAMGVFMGAAIRNAPRTSKPPPEEFVELFTWMFGALGLALVLFSVTMAVLCIYVGRSLQTARHRVLCLVVAAVNLLSMPLGTLLGIFTIIVLSRESVVARFGGRAPIAPAEDGPIAVD